MTIPTIQVETMLLAWSETSNGGAKIVLQLPSPEDLEPFRAMTLKRGKVAGQRLMAVFAEVNEQEEPVEAAHRKPGALCLLAVKWSRDPNFQAWAGHNWPHTDDSGPLTEEQCRMLVLDVCKISSRRELDVVPAAAEAFQREFRGPYMDYLQGVNG